MLPGSVKNKITDTFASVNNKNENLELEARYGFFTKKGFKPGVNRQTFNRIKAYFDKQTKSLNEVSTDYIMGDVRKSVYLDKVTWMTKTKLWKEDIKEYPIRYSMAREKNISPIDESIFKPNFIRAKNRYSYFIFDDSVRVDITLVSSADDINHEVEVELLNPSKIDKFELAVKIILRLVLDTYEFYTENERLEVIRKINSNLGSIERRFIDSYSLVQARNLKLRDMVGGGLIGNSETGYTVTHKTDGQRKMVAFLNSGIWLLASNSINRVSRNYVKFLEGTILDGEMVPIESRTKDAPKNRIWYLIFDVLSENGDKSIQNKPHAERMNFAQQRVIETLKEIKLDIMLVNTKSFRGFQTPVEFFELMREMYREQPLLPYKQDGFMFTPANTEYNPHSDRYKLNERILTKIPDVCKWKPKDELTIDFQIRWINKKIGLYVNFKGNPVPFEGTFFHPLSPIDYLNPLTLDLPNNTVVEYGYDYEKNILVPRRIRHDKTKPNKEDVAQDVWSDIHDPLEEETMKGNNFTLLRKYHNRIKKELLHDSIREKTKNKTLLDIGSGYGGDLGKWKKFDKILAVEPDLEHIEEMKKRIQTYNMENKVRILQAGGEETEKIKVAVDEWIGGKVDVVSSMLSLTFFWQNSKLVDSLVNTVMENIKEDGKYIFLTMDGDLVEQTFEPAFKTGLVLDKLDLGPATLVYKGNLKPKELYINIKGTIVEEQKEWLVRLDDLKIRFNKYGFDFLMMEKADEEIFLTQEEDIMSRMYTYGMISKVKGLPETKPLVVETRPVLPPIETRPVLPPIETKPVLPPIETRPVLPPIETKPPVVEIRPPVVETKPPVVETKPVLPPIETKPPVVETKPVLPSMKKLPPLKKIPAKTKKDGEKELEMLPMNAVEFIKVTWWHEKVLRIGSIGDGSCYFHSVLNSYLKYYQTNSNQKFREDFVKKIRKELALTLSEPNPNDPNKTWYETAANGQFLSLYEQQLLGIDFKDIFDQKVDFSLKGLEKHIDSTAYLGDEIYSFAAEVLGLDIYIMRLTDKDLYVHLNTHIKGKNKRSVVISGNGYHFESIGIERNGLYQTFFDADDPFIIKIRSFSSE
jgi:SAM-dependent methyltransferase